MSLTLIFVVPILVAFGYKFATLRFFFCYSVIETTHFSRCSHFHNDFLNILFHLQNRTVPIDLQYKKAS